MSIHFFIEIVQPKLKREEEEEIQEVENDLNKYLIRDITYSTKYLTGKTEHKYRVTTYKR